MNKSKLFLCTVLACSAVASLEAVAQEFKPQVWANAGLLSYHFDRSRDHREQNWGLGAEYIFRRDHGLMLGTYVNSESQHSKYLGYEWRPLHWQPGGVN